MTKSSSSSPHSKARLFFYIALVVFVGVNAINLLATLTLQKAFRKAAREFLASDETSLTARSVYFNILKGATISGLEVRKEFDVLFSAQRVDVGLDGASLFRKKVKIKNIRLVRPFVALRRLPDSVRILRKQAAAVGALGASPEGLPATLYETVFFQAKDIVFEDALTMDMSGYLNCIKGELWVSRGTILAKKIRFPALPDMDFFEGSHFYKTFDFTLEMSMAVEGLSIRRLELSNPRLRFTGSGDIVAAGEKPRVDFKIDFPNILLEDFPVLNQPQVRSRGILDGTYKVTGPPGNVQSSLSLRLNQGEFTFFNALLLSKVNGVALMTPEHLTGQDFSLSINDMPLKASFEMYSRQYPHLTLRLSSYMKAAKEPAVEASLSADWLHGSLAGDAEGFFKYQSQQAFNTLSFRLHDFRLGFDENLFLNAKALDGGFVTQSVATKDSRKVFGRDLTLQNLFGVFRTGEEGFFIDRIKAACYDGVLEGKIQVIPEKDMLAAQGEVHLKDVNLRRLAQDSSEPVDLTQGRLDGDLRFDSRLQDQLKGQIFIVNGEIENNPILDGVADFLGVASLKKISFGDLSSFFNGGRGNYSVRVTLTSSLVNGSLEGKVTSYEKMDGYLSVSIATQLLNESKYFKKLLIYLKHDEPSVVFPFKISSYMNSPRILWLRNEFKEKLQHLLPESNKRVLQGQINTMVEKIREE